MLEAATGDGVVQLLREACSIDLLVTDIGLGDDAITGWDVAEAVRTKHAEVPVIYASGGPDNEGRRVPKSVCLWVKWTLILGPGVKLETGRSV